MKTLKKILLIILIIILTGGIIYVWLALPIISGYGAKNLCSCVFISGREADEVIAEDLNFSLVKYGSYEVNYNDSSAIGSVFGLAKRKAIYRKKYGCTLIVKTTEEELKKQKLPDINQYVSSGNSDSLKNATRDSTFSNGDKEELLLVINDSFNDSTYGLNTGTRGIVVYYNGGIIAEKYKSPFTPETPQLGWSMTKSITNSLIGIMIKKERLSIQDDELFPFWKDDPRAEITIDDLLRMSSGLEWWENYGGVSDATKMLYKSYNTGLYAAQRSLEHDPGSKWYYSSGTTNLLSLLLKEKLNLEDYLKFPHEELFQKLGMTTAILEPDASGTYVASSYMFASPRDWTKFGMLILNDGVWNGERLLPEGWVEYSSSLTKNSNGEYGAHFWLNKGHASLKDVPEDVIIMSGFQGQRVFILPSQNLIITRLGHDPEENFDFNGFVRDIIAAIG